MRSIISLSSSCLTVSTIFESVVTHTSNGIHPFNNGICAGEAKERSLKDEVAFKSTELSTSASTISKQKETIADLRAALETARAGATARSPTKLPEAEAGDGQMISSEFETLISHLTGVTVQTEPSSSPSVNVAVARGGSSEATSATRNAPFTPAALAPAAAAALGVDLHRLLRHVHLTLTAMGEAKAAAEGQLAKLASEASALRGEVKAAGEQCEEVARQAEGLLAINATLTTRVTECEAALAAARKSELTLQAALARETAAVKQASAAVEAKTAGMSALQAQAAAAEEAVAKRGDLLVRANESLGLQEASLTLLRAELLRLRETVDGHSRATAALTVAHEKELSSRDQAVTGLCAELAAAQASADKALASAAAAEGRLSAMQASLSEAQLARASYHGQLVALEATAVACWCMGAPKPRRADACLSPAPVAVTKAQHEPEPRGAPSPLASALDATVLEARAEGLADGPTAAIAPPVTPPVTPVGPFGGALQELVAAVESDTLAASSQAELDMAGGAGAPTAAAGASGSDAVEEEDEDASVLAHLTLAVGAALQAAAAHAVDGATVPAMQSPPLVKRRGASVAVTGGGRLSSGNTVHEDCGGEDAMAASFTPPPSIKRKRDEWESDQEQLE